jgi:hypothetical protein
MISRRRRIELAAALASAVMANLTRERIRKQYFKYLGLLYKEGNELEVFLALRRFPRRNGARIDLQLVSGQITQREAYRKIKRRCADVYARHLNEAEIADINLDSRAYRQLTRRMAFQVLKAFEGVDPDDKTAVCISMAKTWHQFVRELHQMYNLPTVRRLRNIIHPESLAELQVLDSDDFETIITPADLARLEKIVE